MITDALSLLAQLRMPADSTRVLVQRPGHLVVRAETAEGPVVLKASRLPAAGTGKST